MKILFSGGGTLGPVTPLLAIRDSVDAEHPDAQYVWVGTKKGPERVLVEEQGIIFHAIQSGKFRRYFSLLNVVDVFRFIIGWLQSLKVLWKESPDVCISAGGFTSVPLHWAAWLFGIPTWIHQQDIHVGLANKLMVPIAKAVTTATEEHLRVFPKRKTTWLGNPVRQEILKGDSTRAKALFELQDSLPVIFATGGGTGSLRVNQLIVEAVGALEGRAQVIHLTGRERSQDLAKNAARHLAHYQVHDFFTTEMKDAYAVADIVISRGGFGTITEIAALKKVAVLIPKPGQQEENVAFLDDAGAAILVDEATTDGLRLAKILRDLLDDAQKRKTIGERLGEVMPVAKNPDILNVLKSVLK